MGHESGQDHGPGLIDFTGSERAFFESEGMEVVTSCWEGTQGADRVHGGGINMLKHIWQSW